MPCYKPLQGYRSRTVNASGKRSIVFSPQEGYADLPVEVACGQCIGCRLERSRQWAVRCVHEAQLHEQNMFVTLTYDNKHLPADGSVHVEDFQAFMKRYRKRFGKVRYFHCGEYGEETRRPHYHALIFGHRLPDLRIHKQMPYGPLYTSALLEQVWGQGLCTVGEVTFDSAAYVARYVMKKVTGEQAERHYESVDTETGEIGRVFPEYVTMSRRPGIGADWLKQFGDDVYPHDYVVVNGVKVSPVRFYDRKYQEENPEEYKKIKYARLARAGKNWANNTPERLRTREVCATAKLSLKKRNIE